MSKFLALWIKLVVMVSVLFMAVVMVSYSPVYGEDLEQAQSKISQAMSPQEKVQAKAEIEKDIEKSKDWKLIAVKFGLWFGLMVSMGMVFRKKIVTAKLRPWLLALVVLIFGFILGSDPNPLGTIKDGLVLFGSTGVIFKPRIVALLVLLLTILVGSRIFCGWACHFGVLEDLIYKIPAPKIRIPFPIANSIRIIVFIFMIATALAFGFDLLGYVDPFKIYSLNPPLTNVVAVIIILAMGVFIYRPWCTMVCPFGLLAWMVEKFSFLKLRVDGQACKNCGKCKSLCPTGAVEGKLKGKPQGECYSCGACIDICPQGAIVYTRK